MVKDVISNFGQGKLTPEEYLAGVIQGEAGSPEGQFAVASVIANRAKSGQFPSNPLDVASQGAGTRGPQFSGYNPNYSNNAFSLARALTSGELGRYGDPGNALFYNAKTNNAKYDAGGAIIGGNAFSDKYDSIPSSGFKAPALGSFPVDISMTPSSSGEMTPVGAGSVVPAFMKTPPQLGNNIGPASGLPSMAGSQFAKPSSGLPLPATTAGSAPMASRAPSGGLGDTSPPSFIKSAASNIDAMANSAPSYTPAAPPQDPTAASRSAAAQLAATQDQRYRTMASEAFSHLFGNVYGLKGKS